MYQFHSIYNPISLIPEYIGYRLYGRNATTDGRTHTDILQAPGEPIPPMSIPPMAALAVELGIATAAAVVEELISMSILSEDHV